MAKIVKMTEETARRLRETLYAPGRPLPPFQGNKTATPRTPVLVRALSDTAVGGAEVGGDQCYDAVVLDINSLLDEQAETAPVWLTILDGGTTGSPITVAAPVEGKGYYGLFAGMFDPDPEGDSDPRPRVFATTGNSSGSIDWDESNSISIYDISSDNTWEYTSVNVTVPSTGTYLIMAHGTATGTLTAGGNEAIWMRLYDHTAGAALFPNLAPSNDFSRLLHVRTTGTPPWIGEGHLIGIQSLTDGNEIRIEVQRTNLFTSTWSLSRFIGYSGSQHSQIQLIRLT